MKRDLILVFILFTIFAFGVQAALAQITITIPKIPKIKKPKQEQPKPEQKTGDDNNNNQDQSSEQKTNSPGGDEMDFRLQLFLEKIETAQKQVNEYTPETKIYPVGSEGYEWLVNAVSMRERNKFYEKWKTLLTPAGRNKFETALNKLAAAAGEKLPLYLPNPKEYNFRNAAEEKMLKAELENLANLKIYKIGLKQSAWLIDKNSLGIPTARYKHGMLWVRDSADDHQFCKIYYVNIIQDYAGGGTYGASYAKFTGNELAGCPANAN